MAFDDKKKLKTKVKFEATPLPTVEIAFQYLGKAKVFSVMDPNKAFYKLPLSEGSKAYMALITPVGLFEFNYPSGCVMGPNCLAD